MKDVESYCNAFKILVDCKKDEMFLKKEKSYKKEKEKKKMKCFGPFTGKQCRDWWNHCRP